MRNHDKQIVMLIMAIACFQGATELFALAHRLHGPPRYFALQLAEMLCVAENRSAVALQLLRSAAA